MKLVIPLVLSGLLTIAPLSLAQTSQVDSQPLQSILSELRGIHKDLRLSQTTQILLTEWQLQQANVNDAFQRRNNLKRDITETEAEEKSTEEESTQVEQEGATLALDPLRKKELAERDVHLKLQLKALKQRAQLLSDDLQEASLRLRKEQDLLENIQSQLNDVVKRLQPAPSP